MKKGKHFNGRTINKKIILIILLFIISIIILFLKLYNKNSIHNDEELQDILNDNSEVQNITTEMPIKNPTETPIGNNVPKSNPPIIAKYVVPST